MLQWISSFIWDNNINDNNISNELCTRPGPGRNLAAELLDAKAKLNSPETIQKLRKMSLVTDAILMRTQLRKTKVSPRPTYFKPRHPVINQIASGDFCLHKYIDSNLLLQ